MDYSRFLSTKLTYKFGTNKSSYHKPTFDLPSYTLNQSLLEIESLAIYLRFESNHLRYIETSRLWASEVSGTEASRHSKDVSAKFLENLLGTRLHIRTKLSRILRFHQFSSTSPLVQHQNDSPHSKSIFVKRVGSQHRSISFSSLFSRLNSVKNNYSAKGNLHTNLSMEHAKILLSLTYIEV